MSAVADLDPGPWWVASAPLAQGGLIRSGPYPDSGTAIAARTVLERVENRDDLWVVAAADPAAVMSARAFPPDMKPATAAAGDPKENDQ
jgi:hypothetical protein